ncbi:MAG: cysteine rich repeat-containing protein [Myxococcaceae bacterium]
MSKLPRCWSALAAAAGFLVAPLAFGQPVEPGKPCAADVAKLCPGVKHGHGAILQCLEGKQDQISDACKDVVKAKLEELYSACKDDVAKFCASVEKGQGRIIKCLYKNKATLSDGCKAEWMKMKPAPAPAPAQ